MARWSEIDSVAATLTGVAELRFAANRHHVLGTIRPDGSPRLSGTEVYFHRGDVWIGCMPTSGKVSDLRRDPRCALHTAPIDLEMVEGDAVIDAVAVETEDADVWAAITEGSEEPVNGVLFRMDVTRFRVVQVEDDRLLVHSWDPDRGVDLRVVD